MGEVREVVPVLLVVAVFSRHCPLLQRARELLEQDFGPVALAGEPFAFEQTCYYEASMGPGLLKQLLAFRDLIDPAFLPAIKLRTNAMEQELASGPWAEARPLNVDPGYLGLGKLVLATTKDQAHRLYLRDGIFAEVTLRYRAGAWEPWPWTYADYRLPGVLGFLHQARDYYRGVRGRKTEGREAQNKERESDP